jgi:hypothetical protein
MEKRKTEVKNYHKRLWNANTGVSAIAPKLALASHISLQWWWEEISSSSASLLTNKMPSPWANALKVKSVQSCSTHKFSMC